MDEDDLEDSEETIRRGRNCLLRPNSWWMRMMTMYIISEKTNRAISVSWNTYIFTNNSFSNKLTQSRQVHKSALHRLYSLGFSSNPALYETRKSTAVFTRYATVSYPLPDETRKHINIYMNVILSSYDQVSHRYVPPSKFCINFRSPYTFHHPCFNQQTDLKFPGDKIRSEAYNWLLLLLLLFHGYSARFQAMVFPVAGVPKQNLRGDDGNWFTVIVLLTCITTCLLWKLLRKLPPLNR
jgi:hypothetical protein